MAMEMEQKKTSTNDEDEPEINYRGIKAMPFIIGNETFEKLGALGMLFNLQVYLTTVFNMKRISATTLLNVFNGTTNFSTLIGAYASDTHFGRYKTLGFGSVASFLGLLVITLTAAVKSLHPPHCGPQDVRCVGPSPWQMAFLLSGFGLMILGAGSIRPCNLAFGADQFNPRTEAGKRGNRQLLQLVLLHIILRADGVGDSRRLRAIRRELGHRAGDPDGVHADILLCVLRGDRNLRDREAGGEPVHERGAGRGGRRQEEAAEAAAAAADRPVQLFATQIAQLEAPLHRTIQVPGQGSNKNSRRRGEPQRIPHKSMEPVQHAAGGRTEVHPPRDPHLGRLHPLPSRREAAVHRLPSHAIRPPPRLHRLPDPPRHLQRLLHAHPHHLAPHLRPDHRPLPPKSHQERRRDHHPPENRHRHFLDHHRVIGLRFRRTEEAGAGSQSSPPGGSIRPGGRVFHVCFMARSPAVHRGARRRVLRNRPGGVLLQAVP